MQDRRHEGPDPGADPAGRETGPTADRLREDIDSGRTHDKVAKADPAAAPLGADDEAAGTPPTAEQVATARRRETGRTVAEDPSASRVASQTARRPNSTFIWAIAGVVVVAILLAIIF